MAEPTPATIPTTEPTPITTYTISTQRDSGTFTIGGKI